jgi:Fe-Mn family superoxide dismutase
MQLKTAIPFNPEPGLAGIPNSVMGHHVGLYQGYVTRFNHCQEELQSAAGVVKSGLLGQRNTEYDGARLHEYFFEQLIPGGSPPTSDFFMQLAASSYGTFDGWQRDFYSVCDTPGPGWAITYYTEDLGCINAHIKMHSQGVMVGACPILVVDLWEHAYECYTHKMQYINDVMANMDWSVIERRMS